jgi:hypothetical protein
MTLQAINPPILIPGLVDYCHSNFFNSLLIDAAAEKAAFITYAPKTGTISKVGFRTGTVSAGDTLKISLQSVDASGNPDGTILASGDAYQTQAVADADDNKWFLATLVSGASVTKGDPISIVIEFNSYVAGNLNISAGARGIGVSQIYNIYADLYTTTWTKNAYLINAALEYSDGSYASGFTHPMSALSSYSYNSGSTPDEYGDYFQIPFPCRAAGIVAYVTLNQSSTFTLYDSDGTTVLASKQLLSAQRYGASYGLFWAFFDTPVNLLKDTWYRMTVVPNGTTNISLCYFSVDLAAQMDSYALGQKCYRTSRTDSGAWTQDTLTRVEVALIVDAFDDGAGAGGGLLTHPGMSGGCRG